MRGRPAVGAIFGLLFGLFLALTIQQFGLRPLDDRLIFFGLPVLFFVLGILLGLRAPLGRRKTAGTSPVTETPAASSPTSEDSPEGPAARPD